MTQWVDGLSSIAFRRAIVQAQKLQHRSKFAHVAPKSWQASQR